MMYQTKSKNKTLMSSFPAFIVPAMTPLHLPPLSIEMDMQNGIGDVMDVTIPIVYDNADATRITVSQYKQILIKTPCIEEIIVNKRARDSEEVRSVKRVAH